MRPLIELPASARVFLHVTRAGAITLSRSSAPRLHFPPTHVLSARRTPKPITRRDHLLWFLVSNTLCMTDTISRVIPLVTDDGLSVEIPYSAWDEIKRVAEDEFDAEISFHLHSEPGSYHGWPYVPFAHYLIEVTLDEALAEQFTDRVNPLINDLIESHTQQPAIPVGR